jgi:hypothetical protein
VKIAARRPSSEAVASSKTSAATFAITFWSAGEHPELDVLHLVVALPAAHDLVERDRFWARATPNAAHVATTTAKTYFIPRPLLRTTPRHST